ncbi:hypothetical protein Tco_1455429, partial [Tanacetum coccineum]
MQSPRTLREMQSLSGKLAALKRFLSQSAERSLPFFETQKDVTKENKDEYRWTENIEKAFQEMKKRRPYFEAHPIKVIMDQPLKQILNKAQASGKLAKYSVELGTYNITYEPINVIKGQVLADFLSEAPVGTLPEALFRLPARGQNKDEVERWTLFTNGASNSKGSSAGLVLINPSGVEFTYALRLNFTRVIVDEEEDNWMTPIIRCLEKEMRSEDKEERRALRMKINQYVLEGGVLFKKGYLVPMLRCVGPLQANYIIEEIYMGSYGMHIGA